MATQDLEVSAVLSSTGWTAATVANLSSSNDARATDGVAAELISVDIDNAPGDFGSLNSVTIRAEARVVGSVNRVKNLLIELRDSSDTLLETFTGGTIGATDSVFASSAFTRSDALSVVNGYRIRVTVEEGGGMPDSATVEIDHIQATIDYDAAVPIVTDVETDEDFEDGDTAVTVTGTTFGATQGSGSVELGNNSDYAAATKQAQTVTTWGDTAIEITAVIGTLAPGGMWLFVTENGGTRNDPGFAVTVHRKKAIELVASGNIAASGENTTAQLTAPATKTTGDFGGGRIQDDENPGDTVDLASGEYREDEWSIQANADAVDTKIYEFRLLLGGAVIDTYSKTPQVTISDSITLVVAEALHAHAADVPALTQANTLVVAEALHAHAVDNLGLTQKHTLAPAESVHAHTADVPTVSFGYVLIVGEATHAHAPDNLDLVQKNTLAVAEALHAHEADPADLTQKHTLAADEALHAHGAEAPVITTSTPLVPAEATHAHSVDAPALTQANTIVVAEAIHGHTADALGLTQAHVIVVAEAVHAHTADTPTLDLSTTLDSHEATHAHAGDNVDLTQKHTLAVAETLHAHTADAVVVSISTLLAVAEALHAHGADNVALTQANTLAVAETLHGHGAEEITLDFGVTLGVDNALHAHAGDNLVLSQAHTLLIGRSLHAHDADSIVLTQAHVLVVSEALHFHLSAHLQLLLPGFVSTPGRVLTLTTPERVLVVTSGQSRTVEAVPADRRSAGIVPGEEAK